MEFTRTGSEKLSLIAPAERQGLFFYPGERVDKYFCVLVGGAVGALVRYIVGSTVAAKYAGRFPLGTFLINVSGSFLIGLLMTFFTQRTTMHANWRLLLVTGVLGGYTTFSSFEYEVLVSAQT